MKHKHFLKCGLLAFLLTATVAIADADPACVVSKQENILDGRRDTKTRIFLDITPNNENPQADAYVDLFGTNDFMSLQEFSGMIQVGDIIEYNPSPNTPKDGRYSVIWSTQLTQHNGRNIYEIFVKDLEDKAMGSMFTSAEQANYEERQRHGGR